jgi:outer membrane protein TolC
VLLTCGVAGAQEPDPAAGGEGLTTYTPAHHPSANLSLQDAVMLTIDHDPTLYLAREQSRFDRGVLRQNTGLFDVSLIFDLGYDLQQTEATEGLDQLDTTTASLELGLQKLYRNGMVITPAIEVESLRTDYTGLGSAGVQESTSSEVSFTLDVPLGKGGGRVSTGAQERSAQIDLESSVETQAHQFATSTLRTSLAYWGVVAAQERLELLARSVETNRRIVEISEGLVNAAEMVKGDLAQSRARLAEARAQQVVARQTLLNAQLSLADAIGLRVERAEDLPNATDGWPALPSTAELGEISTASLFERALEGRRDLAATRLDLDSADVLAQAARADLMIETDLSLKVAYRGFDGQDTLFGGWLDALFGRYPGPSGALTFSFGWPFKNNAARGEYAQARALVYQAAIETTDLERVINNNIDSLTGSLLEAIQEIEDRTASSEYYAQLVASELQRFEIGESGVVDMIYTEQEQISQLLSLNAARRNLASLLSQLRYEAGALVKHRIEGDMVVVEEVQPTGYVF